MSETAKGPFDARTASVEEIRQEADSFSPGGVLQLHMRVLADRIEALERERDEARELGEKMACDCGSDIDTTPPWRKP